MVGASDLKVYHSLGGPGGARLGGGISSNQAINGSRNNLFVNVSRSQQIAGEDYYKCVFFKNTHATEAMDNFNLWLSSGSRSTDTTINWSYDPLAFHTVHFDGVDDYLDCGVETGLWSQPLTKFSFAFWMWPADDGVGGARSIVDHGGTDPQSFRCLLPNDSNKVQFQIRDADGVSHSPTATMNVGKFNHIACVYDSTLGSDNLKLYVNSVLSATSNLTETINKSVTLTIGAGAVTGEFWGYMKDFRWSTNYAYNQAQVTAIYTGASNAPDPDYHLPMDDYENATGPLDTESGTKVATFQNGAEWNYNAQLTDSVFTEPQNMVWTGSGTEPSEVKFRKLLSGTSFPVWIWYHVEAGAASMLDDSELFSFKFGIPSGGTGSSGGGGGDGGGGSGTGGNPPPATADYKFAFAGDWGCESETDDVVDLIQDRDYDLVVGLGDNSYDGSASCWISKMNAIKPIFKISAYGNHEHEEDAGTGPYKTFFGDNKTYSIAKFNNMFFMIIDSNIDMDAGSAQHDFIKNALLASLDDSSIVWRVGIIHHPWFGSDSDHSYNDGNSVQAFHRLFQDNKVQFVISGHNHNWQRTNQVVYNSGNPESPTVVDSTSPYSRAKKGIIHVISGTGGHDSGSSLYSLGGQPGFQNFQNRTHNGLWEMVASNNGQTLTCSFVDIDGNKYDTFTFGA